jgi:hypothetical protein
LASRWARASVASIVKILLPSSICRQFAVGRPILHFHSHRPEVGLRGIEYRLADLSGPVVEVLDRPVQRRDARDGNDRGRR